MTMSEPEVSTPLHGNSPVKSYSSISTSDTSDEILDIEPETMKRKSAQNYNKELNGKIVKVNDVDLKEKDSADIKVFTLNCWGLKYVSKRRVERMEAIGNYLSTCDYDIVLLQEVWIAEDFKTICHLVRDTFPFAHHFNHGIIGSGTCILSRVPLQDANFHEFAMNGYPTSILHGDWYAAKGVGVCQIDLYGFNIHIFVSHYHAEYDPKNDVYLGHRVIHALESAQWIKLTSSSADLTIYGGDFNTEPLSVPYKLLRAISSLSDAWIENGTKPGGETNETGYNSFTVQGATPKRIDYIMYRSGPGFEAQTVSCNLPLPHKAPNLDCSYTDHEGVAATIRLKKSDPNKHDGKIQTGAQFRRLLSHQNRSDCVSAAREAVQILDRSIVTVAKNTIVYSMRCGLIVILMALSYLPSILTDSKYHLALDIGLLIPRLILAGVLMVNFLMAFLFNKKEHNALKESSKQLKMIMDYEQT